MKILNYLLILFGTMLSAAGFAAPKREIPPISAIIHEHFDIQTRDIEFEGKSYRLFTAAPKQQNAPLAVLYLLDGNAQFPLALNALNLDRTLPLIVGIGYAADQAYLVNERTRDYTPLAEGEAFSKGGGAADFLRFIGERVKPQINTEYLIDEQRQFFFGHSFGGLFGLYVLFNRADLFQHYIIASPSIWWGNGVIIPQQKNWIKQTPHSILLTLGEYEETPEADPQMNPQRLAKIKSRQQVMQTRELGARLRAQGNPTEFYLIPQQNHGGSIPYAIERAVNKVQAGCRNP